MNTGSNKQNSNLSIDELKHITTMISEVGALSKDLRLTFSQNPLLLRQILGNDFHWSGIYEYTLVEQVEIVLRRCFGLFEKIIEIAKTGDQASSNCLQLIQDDSISCAPEEDISQEQKKTVLVTTYSLFKTLESIQIHGQSLNHLIRKVKQGNDEALFKIIEIDHSAMSCPCIADRIALAELEHDHAFFISLQKALNGPTKKKFARFRELRFLLEVLDEDGILVLLSIQEQYQLFCVDLGVYQIQGSDPAKSLHQFIRRWKKERST